VVSPASLSARRPSIGRYEDTPGGVVFFFGGVGGETRAHRVKGWLCTSLREMSFCRGSEKPPYLHEPAPISLTVVVLIVSYPLISPFDGIPLTAPMLCFFAIPVSAELLHHVYI